ncbi:hypothetical protein LY76DRAFT_51810 [Colletotrichum caudatum]|nr:hypothetical protein LY76DRAFT_51810 [Colletotrichum caudatum]
MRATASRASGPGMLLLNRATSAWWRASRSETKRGAAWREGCNPRSENAAWSRFGSLSVSHTPHSHRDTPARWPYVAVENVSPRAYETRRDDARCMRSQQKNGLSYL